MSALCRGVLVNAHVSSSQIVKCKVFIEPLSTVMTFILSMSSSIDPLLLSKEKSSKEMYQCKNSWYHF